MHDTTETTSTLQSVWATLHGGPESIPYEKRVQLVSPLDDKIKLPHYGGYEHFERIADLGTNSTNGTSEEIAFLWTTRTEVAE